MREKRYSSQGIVLARLNYGEADRIIYLFSKDYGKMVLMARGIRKPRSRKRGSLEVFSQIKYSAARGKGMDLLTEVETIKNYRKIREGLKKVALAYYFMEVIGRTVNENEPNKKVYDLLLNYLSRLAKTRNLKVLRYAFVFELLTSLGFWPKDRKMDNPDYALESVLEREIYSKRVGKQITS